MPDISKLLGKNDPAVPRRIKKTVKNEIPPVNEVAPIKDVAPAENVATNKNWDGDLWKKIVVGVVLVVLVVLAGTTIYFYRQWRQTKTNPQGMAKDALSAVVAQVGKLIELPTGEEPTMATVTSVEKLKDQPFFAHAQNGDKALIFSKAGKAILYRPSTDKIIEVISLVGSSNQLGSAQIPQQPAATAEAAPATTETPAATTAAAKVAEVVIYNGTTQKGLAKNVATKIAGMTEAHVASTGNAKGTFAKTIVVDLSGSNQALVQKIAQTVGGEVGNFPDGESRPEADILIIGGSDFKN